jgi:CRP-like cAMP-binding protein
VKRLEVTPVVTHELVKMIAEHPFFKDLKRDWLEFIAGCAKNVHFKAGETIFREASQADMFYLLRHGEVSLELRVPGKGFMIVQTLHAGDALGWSWLFSPYQWHFDARALSMVRATVFDARCFRQKCEADHDFGYEMMKRFSAIMLGRLQSTRLQLLDLYGKPA